MPIDIHITEFQWQKMRRKATCRVECVNQYLCWKIWLLHQRTQSIPALNSLHSTDLVLCKQNSVLLSLTQKPQSSFPPRCVSSTWSSRSPSQNRSRRREGGWRTGPRALPEAVETSHSCCARGLLPVCSQNSSGEEQQTLHVQRSCVWRACLIFINKLQTIPFSGSFLPSESLTAVILTFKERAYFVLSDWHF